MSDKNIFENNVKSLIQSAGPQHKMPDNKKNQILSQLIGTENKIEPYTKTSPVWKLALNHPMAKLAAAAVIIAILGLFLIHSNTEKQNLLPTNGTSTSQLPPTTLLSMSLTFQKEGMKGLEEQLDKTSQTLNRPYTGIDLSDILKELNNHENERINL